MNTLTDVMKAVFFDIPLMVVKAALSVVEKRVNSRGRLYIWIFSVLISVVVGVLVARLKSYGIISTWSREPKNLFSLMAGFYLVYVFMMFPVLVPYHYLKEAKFKGDVNERRFKFKAREMFEARSKAKPEMVLN